MSEKKPLHPDMVEKDTGKAVSLFWNAINSGDRVDRALKDMAAEMKQLNRPDEAIEAIRSFRYLCPEESQESIDNVLVELYKVVHLAVHRRNEMADPYYKDQTDSDRLSALTSDVLTVIIQRLDLKEAARTSLLSKQFRGIWHGIENVKLCDNALTCLTKVNGVPKVESFELLVRGKCSKRRLKLGIKWLRERNVQTIVVMYDDRGEPEITSYPTLIFNLESLVALRLESPVRLKLPKSIRLPELKSFDFTMKNKKFSDFVNALVKACPALEVFYLTIDLGGANTELPCNLELESSSLRWLAIVGPNVNRKQVVVDCNTVCLRSLSIISSNIDFVPHKILFKGLTKFNFRVEGVQQFQKLNFILESCELLEEVGLEFMVVLDLRVDWDLYLYNKKLKVVKIFGYLGISKDLSIVFRTPELQILHIQFKNENLKLNLTWEEVCNLACKNIFPIPIVERLPG